MSSPIGTQYLSPTSIHPGKKSMGIQNCSPFPNHESSVESKYVEKEQEMILKDATTNSIGS